MSDFESADEIYRRAAAAGLTIGELSQRAGVAASTFVRWKGGRSSPSLRTYERIFKVVRDAEQREAIIARRKLRAAASPPQDRVAP
jgi:predicted transcriptional regulator